MPFFQVSVCTVIHSLSFLHKCQYACVQLQCACTFFAFVSVLHTTRFVYFTDECVCVCVCISPTACTQALSSLTIVTRCHCLGTEANNGHQEPKGSQPGEGVPKRFRFHPRCHFNKFVSWCFTSFSHVYLQMRDTKVKKKKKCTGASADGKWELRLKRCTSSCFSSAGWRNRAGCGYVICCFDTVSQGRDECILEWR